MPTTFTACVTASNTQSYCTQNHLPIVTAFQFHPCLIFIKHLYSSIKWWRYPLHDDHEYIPVTDSGVAIGYGDWLPYSRNRRQAWNDSSTVARRQCSSRSWTMLIFTLYWPYSYRYIKFHKQQFTILERKHVDKRHAQRPACNAWHVRGHKAQSARSL